MTNESVFHHYIALSENRNKTRDLLNEKGIKTEIHYPDSAETNFQKLAKMDVQEKSREASQLARKTISLPLSPWITETETDYILHQISLESIRLSFLGDT
jgi:dTDP-4-amino-4,6-dideoxygalactose transaminase